MLSQVRKMALVCIFRMRQRTSRSAVDYFILLRNPLVNRLPTVWGKGTIRGAGVRENEGTRGGGREEASKGIEGQRSRDVVYVCVAFLKVGAVPGSSDLIGSLAMVFDIILCITEGKAGDRDTLLPRLANITFVALAIVARPQQGFDRGGRGRGIGIAVGRRCRVGRGVMDWRAAGDNGATQMA